MPLLVLTAAHQGSDMGALLPAGRQSRSVHADKGKLMFLRWENPRCAGCASSCMRTGTVYEGERTFACADKTVEECSCDTAPGPDCSNDADEPSACAVHSRVVLCEPCTWAPLHAQQGSVAAAPTVLSNRAALRATLLLDVGQKY